MVGRLRGAFLFCQHPSEQVVQPGVFGGDGEAAAQRPLGGVDAVLPEEGPRVEEQPARVVRALSLGDLGLGGRLIQGANDVLLPGGRRLPCWTALGIQPPDARGARDLIRTWFNAYLHTVEKFDATRLGPMMDENFELRRSICRLPEAQVDMVERARRAGATAKFAGSGGAIVGTYPDRETLARVTGELESIGCRVICPLGRT